MHWIPFDRILGSALRLHQICGDSAPSIQQWSVLPTLMEQNTRILAMPDTDASVAMEIMMGNSTIRFFNNTNPDLIRTTLQCLGGMSHAW